MNTTAVWRAGAFLLAGADVANLELVVQAADERGVAVAFAAQHWYPGTYRYVWRAGPALQLEAGQQLVAGAYMPPLWLRAWAEEPASTSMFHARPEPPMPAPLSEAAEAVRVSSATFHDKMRKRADALWSDALQTDVVVDGEPLPTLPIAQRGALRLAHAQYLTATSQLSPYALLAVHAKLGSVQPDDHKTLAAHVAQLGTTEAALLHGVLHAAPRPPHALHLYRGMHDVSGPRLAALTRVGARVQHRGKWPVSTSMHASVAAGFARAGGVVLHFVLPSGYPALAVGGVAVDYLVEDEVMLPTHMPDGSAASFTVTRVQQGALLRPQQPRAPVTVVTLRPLPVAAAATVGGSRTRRRRGRGKGVRAATMKARRSARERFGVGW